MTIPVSRRYSAGWYRARARQRPVTTDDSKELADSAWRISGRLMSGILVYAGLGWLLSLWVGNQSLCVAVGAMVGLGLSYYFIFLDLSRDEKRLEDASRGGAMNARAVPSRTEAE